MTNQRLDIPSLDRPSVVMTDRWRYVVWGEQDIEELFDIQADRSQTTNVLDDHPDVVTELRSQLNDWWGRATAAGFDRQRIIVGNAAEDPARLSAMDWMEAQSTDDVPWNPGFQPPKAENPYARWLGRETEFGALPWYVEVAADGDYEIALYLHDKPAATPVRLNYAVLEINGQTLVSEIQEWTAHAFLMCRSTSAIRSLRVGLRIIRKRPALSFPLFRLRRSAVGWECRSDTRRRIDDSQDCLAVCSSVGSHGDKFASFSSDRPNVILLMADDMGWGDVSFKGHPDLRTPSLDAMADAGLVFDRFYSAAPVCSPTRASVLTGKHPFPQRNLFCDCSERRKFAASR